MNERTCSNRPAFRPNPAISTPQPFLAEASTNTRRIAPIPQSIEMRGFLRAARVRLHLLLERPMAPRATDLSADLADRPDDHADPGTSRICPGAMCHPENLRRLASLV